MATAHNSSAGTSLAVRTIRFYCFPCDESFHATVGQAGTLVGLFDTCPCCRDDANAVYCEACAMESPALDDRCRTCVVNAYLSGEESFETDDAQNAGYAWWPEVRGWVLEARAQLAQMRSQALIAAILQHVRPVAMSV